MAQSLAKRQRAALRRRDEPNCYYCGHYVPQDGHGLTKESVEHLQARRNAGGHAMPNLRLAHAWCNGVVGHIPVNEKIIAAQN